MVAEVKSITEPDPGATGVFQPERMPKIPVHWALIFLLLGGGGGSFAGAALWQPDAAVALHKVEELETQFDDLRERQRTLDADLDGAGRMLRDQHRVLLYLVDVQGKHTQALGALAKAQDVEVDLSVPSLGPVLVREP